MTYRCAVKGTEAGPVAGFLNRDDSVALTIGAPGSGAVVTVRQGDEAVWQVASCVAREWSRPIELDHEVRWLPDLLRHRTVRVGQARADGPKRLSALGRRLGGELAGMELRAETVRVAVVMVFSGRPLRREELWPVTRAMRTVSGMDVPVGWDAVVRPHLGDRLEATLLVCTDA
ncbi:MAG: hypothetical protein UHD09_09210 [Bifidobacterium sp.]|nr:hypothetical protein [Bifidobacterium sp.]